MQVPSWSKYILKYNNFKDAWMPEIRKRKLQTIYPSYFACFVSHTIKVSTTWDIGVVQFDGGSAACGSVMLKLQQIPACYSGISLQTPAQTPHKSSACNKTYNNITPLYAATRTTNQNPTKATLSMYTFYIKIGTYTHKLTPNAHTLLYTVSTARQYTATSQPNPHKPQSSSSSSSSAFIWTNIQSQTSHPRFLQNNIHTQRRHVLATLPMTPNQPAPFTKLYEPIPTVCMC